jgi:hypothetical protein
MTDQSSARVVKWPTDEEVKAEFDAYTNAVGKVVHAWNYLHERLGRLFVRLVNAPDRNVTAAVWYSTYSDRVQRDMLQAAIIASNEIVWTRLPIHAKDDLLWLMKHATNELANKT